MRNTLRFFGLLDVITIALMTKQVYYIFVGISQIPQEMLSIVKVVLLLLIYALLFGSAVGLLMIKKFGSIIYYVQFPIRLIVWVFSFGFLTLLSEYVQINIFDWLFRIVVLLEFFRLYYTIKIQRIIG